MTIEECKRQAVGELKGFSPSPVLDASVLLSEILGLRREELILHNQQTVSSQQISKFFDWVNLRKTGLPVAYLTQSKEFMGMNFYVDRRVLIPRPDTEILVDEALRLIKLRDRPQRIIDVCTGSGCIILSLAEALGPEHHLIGTDLSRDALAVAEYNRDKHQHETVMFQESDLLESISGDFDFILSNPPYLSPRETEQCLKKGWQEPRIALDGGEEGLNIPYRLITAAVEKLYPKWLFYDGGIRYQMPLLKPNP
jgi:release factor glutamine methyltransferase